MIHLKYYHKQKIMFDNLVLTYENMLAKCETARPSMQQRNK